MAKHDPTLDTVFTALSDPTRRAILARLGEGPASVSDLAAPFDMALPSLMGHLRKLEAAGLIASAKDGRVRTCALIPGALAPATAWLDRQRQIWEGRLDRLDAVATAIARERKT